MTKTYEQRLNEIAEEMAKEFHQRFNESEWDELLHSRKSELIKQHIKYAAIAIKHMAESYKEGHYRGAMDMANATREKMTPLSEHLQSLGLQPQKP